MYLLKYHNRHCGSYACGHIEEFLGKIMYFGEFVVNDKDKDNKDKDKNNKIVVERR